MRLPQPRRPGPLIYISQEQGGPVIPPGTGSIFVVSYGSQGYGGGILTRPHTRVHKKTDLLQVKSSYITTDGQPASISWCYAPISHPRGSNAKHRPLYCCMLFTEPYHSTASGSTNQEPPFCCVGNASRLPNNDLFYCCRVRSQGTMLFISLVSSCNEPRP
jgi:hypothetical protein